MKKVIEERKDVVFFVKIFQPPMNSEMYEKSKTIACQKSLKLLEDVFAGKQILKSNCNTTILEKNFELAELLGVTGTPALIFPSGKIVIGNMDSKALENLIEK